MQKGLYPCDVAVMCVWAPCLLCQELNELDAHTPPKRQYVVPFPQSMSTPLVQQQMDVFAYGPAPPSPLVPTYSA